jgi:hypothetical protein
MAAAAGAYACGGHLFVGGQATPGRVASPIGFRPPMLYVFAYSWLRLLLDLVDVRLRVRDPEGSCFFSGTSFESYAVWN